MKKILLVLFAVCVITASAQEKKWSYQAGAGIGISKASSQVNSKAQLSAQVFAFAQYRINDYIALESGLLYSYAPTKFEYITNPVPTEYESEEYKINYHKLSIPVLVKAYVMPTEKNGLNFFAGPQVDFSLSQKGTVDGLDADFKDVTKGVNLSAVLGVGYDFKFGLTLSLNETLGITGLNKGHYQNMASSSKLNITSLRVGWRF